MKASVLLFLSHSLFSFLVWLSLLLENHLFLIDHGSNREMSDNTQKQDVLVPGANEKEESTEPRLLDPDECLTDEESTTDEDDDAEDMFPEDQVDEDDGDEEQSTTDTGPDVLPFAGFANAATGVQLPAPSTEALEHAKKVLGLTSEPGTGAPEKGGAEGIAVSSQLPPLPQYPPQEVCFRRASNGEKWLC